MADAETLQRRVVKRKRRGNDVSDEIAHFLSNRVEKAVDLGGFPLDDQFDAAVGKVPHVTDDLATPSQPGGGGPKAYTPNPPGE